MNILHLIAKCRDACIKNETPIIYKNNQVASKGVSLFTADNSKIFAIERNEQKIINYDQLRFGIQYHMGIKQNYPRFTQLIGDSQLFSASGTRFAQHVLNEFVNKMYPDSIVLFGFTGKYDEQTKATEVNHLLSLMVDNKTIDDNRVLANMVDFHTPAAISEWPGTFISENIKYFTLVYSDSIKPETKFGEDTPTTDNLTNSAAICFEGGIQSLLQAINLLNRNIPVVGVTGLRDLSDMTNPRYYDVDSSKPYLSAIGFLQYIQEKTKRQTITETDIKKCIAEYLNTYALYNIWAKDADTKQALWEEAMNKFITYKTWTKLDRLELISNKHRDLQHETTFVNIQGNQGIVFNNKLRNNI